MRMVSILMILLSTPFLMAHDGEMRDIDGLKFKNQAGVWIQEQIGDQFQVNLDNVAVFRGEKWQQWQQADARIAKILELGPNVVFQMADAQGRLNTYSVFENQQTLSKALSNGAQVQTAQLTATGMVSGTQEGKVAGVTTADLVGDAGAGGDIVIQAAADDSDTSSNAKR